MDPNLIDHPIRITWYGLFMTTGIFVAFELAKRILKSRGYDTVKFENAAFWAVIWGVIGARLGYVLTSPGEFHTNPITAFYIWQGGLSFHGGVIGGILSFLHFHYKHGYPLYPYMDAVVPGVSFGIMMGRLGNIMNGSDTVGRLTTLPIGFTWPKSAIGFPGICTTTGDLAFSPCAGEIIRGPVHFTQLYGVLIGFVLLLMSWYWLRSKRVDGYVVWNFVLWYSILRSVFEETFRLNPLWWNFYTNDALGIGLFTATQLVSIRIIILAIDNLKHLKKSTQASAA